MIIICSFVFKISFMAKNLGWLGTRGRYSQEVITFKLREILQPSSVSGCWDQVWNRSSRFSKLLRSTDPVTSRFCRYPSCGSHSSEEMRWLCLIQRVLLSFHMGKICRITVMRPSALWVSSRISVSLISCGDEKGSSKWRRSHWPHSVWSLSECGWLGLITFFWEAGADWSRFLWCCDVSGVCVYVYRCKIYPE